MGQGEGEAWNFLPCSLCFGNTTVYTAVLFQIEDSESSVLVSFQDQFWRMRWSCGQQGRKERRERASPPSIILYLNPVPLELREAGRKMPLPRQPPLLFVGCWLFTKEITCKLGSADQSTKKGSNLQVITESLRNNFQKTKISFVIHILLLKQKSPTKALCQQSQTLKRYVSFW